MENRSDKDLYGHMNNRHLVARSGFRREMQSPAGFSLLALNHMPDKRGRCRSLSEFTLK